MENIQMLLKQHVGAPCAPVVKAGDVVKKGTLIAEPTGLGANIFSSVYGVVEAVTEDRIVIKPDAEQPAEYEKIPEGTILEKVKAAGIVGLGGAGFPTAVKLDAKFEDGGYVLVNASECEPGLKHNIKEIEEDPDKLCRAVEYAMEVSGADKGIIALKKKNRFAVERLDEVLVNHPKLSRQLMADIYPMGEERAVVRECLGIELEPTQLPSAAKAIVLNSETCYKIAEAVEDLKPLVEKNITVRGRLNGGYGAHVFMNQPIGMAVKDLIEKAGGIYGEYGEISMGGAFTGKPCELDDPTVKATGAILVSAPFHDYQGAKCGILVCACGGNLERMEGIAKNYNFDVVSVCYCKQAQEQKNGARKCERPGNCPGQVGNLLEYKKAGAEYVLIGNCSDCSNTVMANAPKLKQNVIHQTDHFMKVVDHDFYRALRISKKVSQDMDFVDNAINEQE